jgi:hypothetical protein
MQHTANSLTYAEAGEVARLGPRRRGEVDLGYEACGVGHWIGARSRGDRAASGSAGMEWKRGCCLESSFSRLVEGGQCQCATPGTVCVPFFSLTFPSILTIFFIEPVLLHGAFKKIKIKQSNKMDLSM